MMVFKTILTIRNDTTVNIEDLEICKTNREDYVDPCRPEAFNNSFIMANESITKNIDLSSAKPCQLKMLISYSDETFDSFEFNYSWLLDLGYNLQLNKERAIHDISFERVDMSLIISIKHTKRQLLDLEAIEMHTNGIALMDADNTEEGIVSLDKAYNIAQHGQLRNEIRDSLGSAHLKIGKKCFSEALSAQEKYIEYGIQMNLSFNHFKKCSEYLDENNDVQQWIKLLNRKMISDENRYQVSQLMIQLDEITCLSELSKNEDELQIANELCDKISAKLDNAKKELEECVNLEERVQEDIDVVNGDIEKVTGYIDRLKSVEYIVNNEL